MSELIYLASPYSDPDPLVMERRFVLAEQATHYLLANKQWVYSPIVHCHALANRYELPRAFSYWQEYNQLMLDRADVLYVLQLDGWERSEGVTWERDYWEKNYTEPIYYMSPTTEYIVSKGY